MLYRYLHNKFVFQQISTNLLIDKIQKIKIIQYNFLQYQSANEKNEILSWEGYEFS